MDQIKKFNNDIRHLEHIQKKDGKGKPAVIGALAETIVKKNNAVSERNHREAVRQSQDRNSGLAREAFEIHGRGKKVFGPS